MKCFNIWKIMEKKVEEARKPIWESLLEFSQTKDQTRNKLNIKKCTAVISCGNFEVT